MSFSEIFGTARAFAEIWNVPLLACHDDTPYPKNREDSRESKPSPAKPSPNPRVVFHGCPLGVVNGKSGVDPSPLEGLGAGHHALHGPA